MRSLTQPCQTCQVQPRPGRVLPVQVRLRRRHERVLRRRAGLAPSARERLVLFLAREHARHLRRPQAEEQVPRQLGSDHHGGQLESHPPRQARRWPVRDHDAQHVRTRHPLWQSMFHLSRSLLPVCKRTHTERPSQKMVLELGDTSIVKNEKHGITCDIEFKTKVSFDTGAPPPRNANTSRTAGLLLRNMFDSTSLSRVLRVCERLTRTCQYRQCNLGQDQEFERRRR